MGVEIDPALKFLNGEIARNRIINETIVRGESGIQQFYRGATVFVTGASGFLGKQLIEKLLRSCEIDKIFILLRIKKNKTPEERLQSFIEDPVFEVLKEMKPDFHKRVELVQGDVAEINIGLSTDDWKTLTEQVTMIFHGAATVNFTEPINVATMINVRGVREMIKLAKECKHLKSMVHVSTAYTHATPELINKQVFEKFYDSPISPDNLIGLVEQSDTAKLDKLTDNLIKPWPNTYSFTKAVAEEGVRKFGEGLPICIVRPAIVISAYREPVPGWIDPNAALGPTGLIIGGGLGLMHVAQCNLNINVDFVPVDVVNNAIIAAAHTTALRHERGEADIKIYTVSGNRNSIKYHQITDTVDYECSKYPSDKMVYHAGVYFTSNEWSFWFLSWLFHLIPGYVVDMVLRIMGKRPIVVKIIRKVNKLINVISFFMSNGWTFMDTNLEELYWEMSPDDRIIYDCNLISLDWKRYLILWAIGCRKYIIKDGLNRTSIGLKKMYWLRLANVIIFPLYLYTLLKILSVSFNAVCYVLSVIFIYS